MRQPQCPPTSNHYDERVGLRITSIFVILVGSFLGAWLPVLTSRRKSGVASCLCFIGKYFGSGVILGTAFIHLLAPASKALRNPCLTGPITCYPWTEAICLMAIFVLFTVELFVMRYAQFGAGKKVDNQDIELAATNAATCHDSAQNSNDDVDPRGSVTTSTDSPAFSPESYSARLTAIFILESGIVFHSIFIGLTLAVSGSEFPTLFAVLTLHQTFEGLALGSRLASMEWPKPKRWTPYLLAGGYALSTPAAIAAGLAMRSEFSLSSQMGLIVTGVFDSISAGILIFTATVELFAHEFLFNGEMQRAPLHVILESVGLMALGTLSMAVLGKWA